MRRTDSTTYSAIRRLFITAILTATAVTAASMFGPSPAPAASERLARTIFAAQSAEATTPLPLLMADTSGARQLLIATTLNLGDTTGTLQVFVLVDDAWVEKLTVPARFGRNGLMDGRLRTAGNKTTPTGIWAMPNYIFGTHLRAPVGSNMKFRRLSWESWWSSRRGKTYNTWVAARHWTGEHIGGSPKAYEFAVSTGYNALPNPSVFGRGTGIFLHVWGGATTAGCVSISRANMIRVCRILDRTQNPHFAVGTLQTGTPTSIWAY